MHVILPSQMSFIALKSNQVERKYSAIKGLDAILQAILFTTILILITQEHAKESQAFHFRPIWPSISLRSMAEADRANLAPSFL